MSIMEMETIENQLDRLDKRIRVYEDQIRQIQIHKDEAEAQYTIYANKLKEGRI